MAFTYGFYNSKGGDRKYNADQMGNLFDGILNDGVFDNVGNIFATVPGEGLQVLVKSGRAWFNKTWSYNDAAYPIYLERPDVAVPRIDAIVLEVDRREAHRRNRIGYIVGIPDSTPKKPTLTNTDLIHQHPLAYVTVRAGTESILHSDIEIRVGQSDCPFVTGILQTANIDDLFAAWNEQFTTWFERVKSQLEGDVAANLLKEIQLRVPIADKSTKAVSEALTDDTKWMTPLQTGYAISKHPDVGKLKNENVVYDLFVAGNLKINKPNTSYYTYDVNKIVRYNNFPCMITPNQKYIVSLKTTSSTIVRLIDRKTLNTLSTYHDLAHYKIQNTGVFYVTDTRIIFSYIDDQSDICLTVLKIENNTLSVVVNNSIIGASTGGGSYLSTYTNSILSMGNVRYFYIIYRLRSNSGEDRIYYNYVDLEANVVSNPIHLNLITGSNSGMVMNNFSINTSNINSVCCSYLYKRYQDSSKSYFALYWLEIGIGGDPTKYKETSLISGSLKSGSYNLEILSPLKNGYFLVNSNYKNPTGSNRQYVFNSSGKEISNIGLQIDNSTNYPTIVVYNPYDYSGYTSVFMFLKAANSYHVYFINDDSKTLADYRINSKSITERNTNYTDVLLVNKRKSAVWYYLDSYWGALYDGYRASTSFFKRFDVPDDKMIETIREVYISEDATYIPYDVISLFYHPN